jgi:hypothetical protein
MQVELLGNLLQEELILMEYNVESKQNLKMINQARRNPLFACPDPSGRGVGSACGFAEVGVCC